MNVLIYSHDIIWELRIDNRCAKMKISKQFILQSLYSFSKSDRHFIFLSCASKATLSFSSIIFSVKRPSSAAYAAAWHETISFEISRPEKPSVLEANSSHFLIKSKLSNFICLTF